MTFTPLCIRVASTLPAFGYLPILQLYAGLPREVPSQEHFDIMVISPMEEKKSISIEQIHALTARPSFAPTLFKRTWVILSPAELLTLPAQQALLKILEEPPAFAQFVLITTLPQMLLPTVLSRCTLIVHEEQDTKRDHTTLSLPKTYAEALRITDTLTKREDATAYIERIVDDASASKTTQAALRTLSQLHKNVNVKLALDHFFFSMLQ